ncbi:hypothetical protein Esti_000593 [Eimeria stiedai]
MQRGVLPVGDPSFARRGPSPAFGDASTALGAPSKTDARTSLERLSCTGSAKAVAISECGGLLFAGIANTIRVYEAPGASRFSGATQGAEAAEGPSPHQGAPLAAVYFSPSEHVLGLREARGLLVAYGAGRLAAYALRKGESPEGLLGNPAGRLSREGPPTGGASGSAQAPTGPLVLQQLLLVKEGRRILAAELLFLSPPANPSSATAAAAATAALGRCCIRACILLMLSDGCVKLLHLATGGVLLERSCSSGPLLLQAAAATVSLVQHSSKPESCCSSCCSCCKKGLMQSVELLLAGGTAFSDVLLWLLPLEGSVLLAPAAAATAKPAAIAAAAAAAALEEQTLEFVQHLRGHRGGLYSLAFAEEGALLASASEDREIRVWARLPHTTAVAAAAAAAARAAATAAAAAPPMAAAAEVLAELRRPFGISNMGALEGAPLRGGPPNKLPYRCVGVLVGHKSRIWDVSFFCLLPRHLLQALQQQQQQQQAQQPQEQQQPSQALTSCCRCSSTEDAFSTSAAGCCCSSCLQLHAASCNLLLASAGEDSTLRIWSLEGICLYTLEAHKGRAIRSLAAGEAPLVAGGSLANVSQYGGASSSFFVTGGEDGCIKVWPLRALPSLWGALQEHMGCSSSALLQLLRRWQKQQRKAHAHLLLSPLIARQTSAAAPAAVIAATGEEALAVYTQQHHNHTLREDKQQQQQRRKQQRQQQQQRQKQQQQQQHAATSSSCGATAAASESLVWNCRVFASSRSPRAAAAAAAVAAEAAAPATNVAAAAGPSRGLQEGRTAACQPTAKRLDLLHLQAAAGPFKSATGEAAAADDTPQLAAAADDGSQSAAEAEDTPQSAAAKDTPQPAAAAADTPQSTAVAAAPACRGACAGLGGSSKDFVREVFFWASKETRGDTLLVSTNYGHVYLLSLSATAEAPAAAALTKQADVTAAATAAGFRHLLLCCVPSPITATDVSDRCLSLGGANGHLRLVYLPSLEDVQQHQQQQQQQQQRPCGSGAAAVTAVAAKAFDGVRVSSVFVFSLGRFLSPSFHAAAASSNHNSRNKEGTPLVPLSRSSDSSSSIWTDMQRTGPDWAFPILRGGLAAAGDHTGALQLYVWKQQQQEQQQQQQQQEHPAAAGGSVAGECPLELLRVATLRLPRHQGLSTAAKSSSSSQKCTNRFMCCLSLVSAAASEPSAVRLLLLSAVLLLGDEHGTLHVALLQVPAKAAAPQQQQQQEQEQQQQQHAWDWDCCRSAVQQPLAELHPRRRVCCLCCRGGFVYCCGGDGRVVILRVTLSTNSSSSSGGAGLWLDQQVVVDQLQAVKVSQISTFVGLFPSEASNDDPWWGSLAASLQQCPEQQGQQQQQEQQQDGFELLQQHVAVGVRGSDLVGFSLLQEAPLLQLPCGDSKRSFAVCRDGKKAIRLAFSRCECVSVFSSSSSISSGGRGQPGWQHGADEALQHRQQQQEQQQRFSCCSFNPHYPGGDVHAVLFLSPVLILAGSEDNTLKLIACETSSPDFSAAAASEGGGGAAAAARTSIDHCLKVLSTTVRHRAAVRAVAELQRWEQQQQQQTQPLVSASRLPRLVASAGAAQTLTLFQVSAAAAAGGTASAGPAASAAAAAATTDSRCGSKGQFEGLLHLGTLCLENRNAEGPSANARFTTACGFVSSSRQQQQQEQQHELQQQPQHLKHKHLRQHQGLQQQQHKLQQPRQQQGACSAFVLIGVSTANLLLIHLSLDYRPEACRAAAAAAFVRTEAVGAAAAVEPVEAAARAVSELCVVSRLRLPAVPLCSQLLRLAPLETAATTAAAATAAATGAAATGAAAAAAAERGDNKETGVVVVGLTDGSLACALLQRRESTSPPLLLPIGTLPVHQRAVTGVCVQVLQQQPAGAAAGAAPTGDPCGEVLRLLVISSGDDDAICLQVLSFLAADVAQASAGAAAAAAAVAAAAAGHEQGSSSSRWRMLLLHRVRYPNAHGSSVRCLSLCGPFLFSLGWDRWLQAWRVHNNSSSSYTSRHGNVCTLCGAGGAGAAAAASSACCCRPPLGCFSSTAAAAYSTAAQRNASLLDRQLETLWRRRGLSPQLQQESLNQMQLQQTQLPQKQLQQDLVAFALQRIAAVRTGVAEAAALATCDFTQGGPTRGNAVSLRQLGNGCGVLASSSPLQQQRDTGSSADLARHVNSEQQQQQQLLLQQEREQQQQPAAAAAALTAAAAAMPCSSSSSSSRSSTSDAQEQQQTTRSKLHVLIQRGAPRGVKKGGPKTGASSPRGPPGWSHNDANTDSTEAAPGKDETIRTQPEEVISSSSSNSSSASSNSSSLDRGSTSQRREEGTAEGDSAPPSLPVVPSRVSRGLGLIQARGLNRSSNSSSNSGGSPSKGATSEGLFPRIFTGRKRPVEISLHVKGDSRKEAAGAGKHVSPAAAAAAAGGPPAQGVISRASLLLLLLLGALLCYITFGGLLFSITGGLLGGPSGSVQQQGRTEAAAAAEAAANGSELAAAPTLVSLEQAVLQLRDRVSSLEGMLKEHEALFAAIEAQLSPTVSSDDTPAAAASRAQRAAGALGHSVASHPAAVVAGVAPPGAAAARARPLLELFKRVRERGAEETASAAAPESPPLVQRSYVAGVASEREPAAAAVGAAPAVPAQELPLRQQQQQQQEAAAATRNIHFVAQEAPHAPVEAGAVGLPPAVDAAAAATAATAPAEAGGGAYLAQLEPIGSEGDRGLGSSALLSGVGGHVKRSKRSSSPP